MNMRSPPEQAVLMDKWSTKSADYNANRVRNNQRRHRARVKSRLEELEAQLQQTNSKLEAALSTIANLTEEVEALRSRRTSTSVPLQQDRPPVPDLQAQDSSQPPPQSEELARPFPNTPELPRPSLDPAIPALADASIEDNCDCVGAPPPALGESTISCSSAFQIINQQNFSGVEVTTIRAWLSPGFRLKPGEACRVETNKLYEILDNITSPS